jgi:hypothetical protein
MVSLLYDASRQTYLSYWFIGKSEDQLIEQARTPDATAAVEWGRARTPRVRIRMPDQRTYWAGTDPAPAGFAGIWMPQAAAPSAADARMGDGDGPAGLSPRPDAPVAA